MLSGRCVSPRGSLVVEVEAVTITLTMGEFVSPLLFFGLWCFLLEWERLVCLRRKCRGRRLKLLRAR